jgi:uncharacterized membrane protein YfcA
LIDLYLIILFLFIGGFTGIFVGLLGIGGGIILVPVLYIFLPYTKIDISQLSYIVIATSLFAGGIASLSSGSRHLLKKNVDIQKALYLISGSIISAYTAPFYVITLNQTYLRYIFAVIFSAISIKMIFENGYGQIPVIKKPLDNFYLFIFGVMIGVISSFAGIGGGILYVPVLFYLFFLDLKKAIGTSAVAAAFTMICSTTSFALQPVHGKIIPYQIGYIYLLAGLPLGIGSAAGAMYGVNLVLKSSTSFLKKIFSLLMIIVILKIIFDL